jgi:hypothetical protein
MSRNFLLADRSSDYLPDFQEITEETISKIKNELESHLENFKGLTDEESSKQALEEIEELHRNLCEFKRRLELMAEGKTISTNLTESPEILNTISDDLDKVVKRLALLKINVDSLKNVSNELGREAGPEEMVEIIDAMPKSKQEWSIKVKSSQENQGHFRSVRILDVEDNRELCQIVLLEPGTEIKLTVDALVVSHHLVANIGDRLISFPYRIPKAKILSIKQNKRLEFTIKNLSEDLIKSVNIVCDGNILSNSFSLNPYELTLREIEFEVLSDSIFFLESQGELLNSGYEYNISHSNLNLEALISDLNQAQKNLIKEVYAQYNSLDPLYVKTIILKYNLDSIEAFLDILKVDN